MAEKPQNGEPQNGAGGMSRADEARQWSDRIHSLLGTPPTDGNEIRVLRNGIQIFPAMLDAIASARRTVDMVTFVYWRGDIAQRFADALADAARRGCRVRVILDALGARRIADELVERMTSAGCEVRWFRPLVDGAVPQFAEANHRTHRKILVCDGEVGFTGGVGIADEWEGDARNENEWRDTHVQLRGPAVAGLAAGFLDNWADQNDDGLDPSTEPLVELAPRGSSRCIVVRGSSETGASEIWRTVLTLLTCARRRVRIATAYFNPDERLAQALCDAVARGVEVQVLLPGEHADKRFVQVAGEATYQQMLDAGVEIRTYETSMMHAKVITVDGAVASIGSANLNQRSMQFDEEATLLVFDPDVVDVFDRHYDDDLLATVNLDPERWAERSLVQRVAERVSSVVDGVL